MDRRLTKAVFGLLAALALCGSAAQGQERPDAAEVLPECGDRPIAIARMQWPSAAILAHIHALILEQAFGCEAEVVAGDLSATTSSMATTGQPAVAPELWITRVADIWNSAIENQAVRQAGPVFAGPALEGWFVPDFVTENNPGLESAAQLGDYWQVFREEGAARARFISCPPDWACAVFNRNLLKAFGLDALFEVVEPENRFALDRLVGEAVSTHAPILFYYWQPNAVLAQFGFRQLDPGGFDSEAAACLARRTCPDPAPSAFAPEEVVIALSEWVFTDAPHIAAYFSRAQMPLAEMNALMAWQSEQRASAEETAAHFVETREEIWIGWVQGS